MFEEMVVSSPKGKKTNKPWTVALSMILQVAFLSVLILIPLIYTEALPKASLGMLLIAPTASSATASSACRGAGCSRQAASAFDGRRQTRRAEGDPQGSKDY